MNARLKFLFILRMLSHFSFNYTSKIKEQQPKKCATDKRQHLLNNVKKRKYENRYPHLIFNNEKYQ